jgi:hypothetical protein
VVNLGEMDTMRALVADPHRAIATDPGRMR